jgi:NAD-dependent deacetylase
MTSDSPARRRAADWIRSASNVVVFTGAGISAESGIATFRDEGGFWSQFPPEQFATWNGLLKTAATQPRQLAEFLLALLEPVARAAPNPGHRAIERLEHHTRVTVVTQNVDGLHQEAGNTVVYEVHGSLFEIVTLSGRFVRLISRREMLQIVEAVRGTLDRWFVLPRLLAAVNPILGLDPGSVHRPRIVLFGAPMAEPAWSQSLTAARACDLMLLVGTSGEVLPAAMLPHEARARGAKLVGVGPEMGNADCWLHGSAGEVLPALVREAFPEVNSQT